MWASFGSPPPQRKSRLYQALVERGRASAVTGFLVPSQDPFLYTVSITVTAGAAAGEVEPEALEAIERVRREGLTADEVARARRQLAARFVFENDSVTNIAHQIGYFHTVATIETFAAMGERLAAVTADQVNEVARTRLAPGRRTVARFTPLAPAGGPIGTAA